MKTKILIVDDSQTSRRIIRNEFNDSQYEIHEAKNGLEGVEKAKEVQPDLITMDVDMPEMNGYQAVYKIRTELRLMSNEGTTEIPIIFITANDTIQGRRKGYEVGATDFILKPFLKGEVQKCAEKLLKSGGSLEGTTVLIVEDSNVSLGILNGILQGEGVTTLLAADGTEALEIFRKEEQNIDLILTDYVMSEMNGDELCSKIRTGFGNQVVPIIVLSGVSESAYILDLFKVGASDYIVKPFAREELLARVKAHLRSSIQTKQLSHYVTELKRLSTLKDDFLSITSHDLRSPITGIMGLTEIVMSDETIGAQNRECLQNVLDSGDFLLNLINDLLDLGQVQSEHYELEEQPISIQDVIEVAVNTVSHMASPKGIQFVTENTSKKQPVIFGDKNALVRIFNNLLSNAIKFTPEGGEVRQVLKESDDNQLSISIIDNGIGIPEDKIPFLFDKFSKASRPGTSGEKSTGLGLSITKQLIERHKGAVSVSSEVGKGTCFQLLFPFADAYPKAQLDETNELNEDEGIDENAETIQVLIADDNKLNVKLVGMVLAKKGYNVSTASNGLEAYKCYVDSLNKGENIFDIIFMDLRMPVLDGFEATDQIRKYEVANMMPHIPIIAMTAGVGDEWEEQTEEKGLTGFITKPVDIKKMQELIKHFIVEKK